MERRPIADYETKVQTLLAGLNRDNHAIACDIAVPPEIICGFGLIKEKNLVMTKAHEAEFLNAYRRPAPKATAAELPGLSGADYEDRQGETTLCLVRNQ